MTSPSEIELDKARMRENFSQAQASSRIEGHIPDPRYLADCEAVIAGTMTLDELEANSLARALAANAASLAAKQ